MLVCEQNDSFLFFLNWGLYSHVVEASSVMNQSQVVFLVANFYFREMLYIQHFYNIFTINFKWKIVINGYMCVKK